MKSKKLDYCIECEESFDEAERFENTNLCINCFHRELDKNQENDLINIYFGTIIEVNLLKNELDQNNITAYLQDENMGVLTPARISPAGLSPFRIMISKNDKDKAKKIIHNFLKKKKNEKTINIFP